MKEVSQMKKVLKRNDANIENLLKEKEELCKKNIKDNEIIDILKSKSLSLEKKITQINEFSLINKPNLEIEIQHLKSSLEEITARISIKFISS